MNSLIEKIKLHGHWKITIRPNIYSDFLIPSLEEAKEIIESNKLSLRGWDYPHVDPAGIKVSGDNSIHSMCDWVEGYKFEYWRFYQTGQFVHYFSMREDGRLNSEKIVEFQQEYGTEANKFLDIISTIYTVTEIFEFASKIFSALEQVSSVEIIVELHDVNNRTLVFWDTFMRSLNQAYVCEYPDGIIRISKSIKKNKLIAESSNFSLDAAIEIFHKFNWTSVSKNIFIEDQKKLLERRL
jgi:hypothetical protein